MRGRRNAIGEEMRRGVCVLLGKGIRPDAAIAERVGCSVAFVRRVRAEMKAQAQQQEGQ